MEKYDYYTIKAAWNGAGVSQRADDIKAAEKIAADLKGNGFIDVVIFGVKAGKREKLEGVKQAKPKAQERPRKAEKPKAKAKAAPKVKTPVNSHKKQEKKAQDNAGQLDLFLDEKEKSFLFSNNELNAIFSALSSYGYKDFKERELEKCFERAAGRGGNIQISLNGNERVRILNALKKRLKDERDPMHYIFLTLINDLV